MKLFPTAIEAYDDEVDMGLFKLSATDEVCADLTISTPVTREGWKGISDGIQRALDMMFPDDVAV